ncbi:hypothetical protein C0993_000234 [Termitomyces sp. T159_Od127]|nr:hypothetical protein C0993_000234 [Termitomyces sp. T159_Od127]
MSESILNAKLQASLASRESRSIRRRLPESTTSSALNLIDFTSNDYLSLSTSPILRKRFLSKLNASPDVLGSGGSRLLVNGSAHSAFEERLRTFFGAEAALLFNSGFDANVGFFSCIPQPGDAMVYDEYIHASVHDGMRASRVTDALYPFKHNDIVSFKHVLARVKRDHPNASVFVAVESLYSMDGTFAPLKEISEALDGKDMYLVVDEAHATGIYGPQGRGRVAELGLEDKVLARLHTFGKALAATGAVILTSTLIRDYLLNYARSLIYTTSLSNANVIAADCSFDLLVDGTAPQLASNLLELSVYFTNYLRSRLTNIPTSLLSLPEHLSSPHCPPSPIIPLMTSHPRPLSAALRVLGMNARPITWPTVPKGRDRVRVCLHAGNTQADVERLALAAVRWAEEMMTQLLRDDEAQVCEGEEKTSRRENNNGFKVTAKQAALKIGFLIVGGDIAGLACAVALRRVGHRVTVLEQDDVATLNKRRESSGPCRIAPNLSKILYHWGLANEVRSIAVKADQVHLLLYETGELLGTHRWGEGVLRDTQGEFLFTQHAALRHLLYELAVFSGAVVRLGTKVSTIDPVNQIVTLADSGEQLRADVIIGADGPTGLTRHLLRPVKEQLAAERMNMYR